jgi:hypothetical protein
MVTAKAPDRFTDKHLKVDQAVVRVARYDRNGFFKMA